MEPFQIVLVVLFCAAVLAAAFWLFRGPMRLALKLALNTVLGFVGLLIFNLIGTSFGLMLGVNWLNAAVIAVLGLPGFALLLILQVFLGA
jgi:inhibitor of the pro-sigma K processing machinery